MQTYRVIVHDYGTIRYYKPGTDELHREDGPAIEWASGDKEWYLNGKLHREDGPAIEWAGGDKSWWLDGKRHRENGPAIEFSNGDKWWYLNGKLHRENGPAFECTNGDKEYWLNNEKLTEKEWKKQVNPSSNDVLVFQGKKYRLVEIFS